jgi:hypothetical protein
VGFEPAVFLRARDQYLFFRRCSFHHTYLHVTHHFLLAREPIRAIPVAASPETLIGAFTLPYVCLCDVGIEVVAAIAALGAIFPPAGKGNRLS